VLLYFLAVGGVRGFAFTLGLTTVVDLLVIFAFTKPMMTILSKWKFYANGHPLSGLSKKSSGIEEKNNSQVSTTGMEA
jgi:preprotein translocase subunit SecD